jgi:uncharacterized protein (DUF1778 family)
MTAEQNKQITFFLSRDELIHIRTAATMHRTSVQDYVKSRILDLAIKDVETFCDLLEVLENNEAEK